jgi:uncharacterized membrane protein
LRLFPDRLVVERIDARGRLTAFSLQPYWLQVILQRAQEPDSTLFLRSHGRQLEVGAFLSGPERRAFADELLRVLDQQRLAAGRT